MAGKAAATSITFLCPAWPLAGQEDQKFVDELEQQTARIQADRLEQVLTRLADPDVRAGASTPATSALASRNRSTNATHFVTSRTRISSIIRNRSG